jgi:hypothetical protein
MVIPPANRPSDNPTGNGNNASNGFTAIITNKPKNGLVRIQGETTMIIAANRLPSGIT